MSLHVCLHLVDNLPEAADKLSMISMHCMHSSCWSSCCCKDNLPPQPNIVLAAHDAQCITSILKQRLLPPKVKGLSVVALIWVRSQSTTPGRLPSVYVCVPAMRKPPALMCEALQERPACSGSCLCGA